MCKFLTDFNVWEILFFSWLIHLSSVSISSRCFEWKQQRRGRSAAFHRCFLAPDQQSHPAGQRIYWGFNHVIKLFKGDLPESSGFYFSLFFFWLASEMLCSERKLYSQDFSAEKLGQVIGRTMLCWPFFFFKFWMFTFEVVLPPPRHR